jgi:cytochrome c oxidase accessory protein FixG
MLKELPQERLASTDEKGKRVYLFPADVRGKYHSRRVMFQWVLMVLFVVLPWIQINGHPAILLDITQRRFAILGLTFWAHDVPMLIFVFACAFLGLSLLTAVWGRIWCGWACPETVFVERLYRQIERWIEGNAVQRERLSKGAWTAEKVLKKGVKWSIFAIISWQLSHAFLAYFIGTDALAKMMISSPAEHPTAFSSMLFITGVLLFSFGWFREQFCIIMCPYGRFQSLLMDEDSMVVGYDEARGEPRRGQEGDSPTGDCINCYQCVQVCPTGIDIRRGVQMECIACTACMDACDTVMDNVHKPHGLIRYTSYNDLKPLAPLQRALSFENAGENDVKNGVDSEKPHYLRYRLFRSRVVILSLALAVVASGLAYVLWTRPPVKATVFSAKGTPYEVLSQTPTETVIINRYYVVASNYTFLPGQLKVTAPEGVEVIAQNNPLHLEGGEEKSEGFFLRFQKSLLTQGSARIQIKLNSQAENGHWEHVGTQEIPLVGPY